MNTQERYKKALKDSRFVDICEHLPTLLKYANECETVTEFGCRYGGSTSAFAFSSCKNLYVYDLIITADVLEIGQECKDYKNFVVHQANTIHPDLKIQKTDLLFIDTYHNYYQLILELGHHCEQVNKYIIMHDTQTFKLVGENLLGDGKTYKGLQDAIDEFLEVFPEWTIKEHFTNNNGLTILKQRG